MPQDRSSKQNAYLEPRNLNGRNWEPEHFPSAKFIRLKFGAFIALPILQASGPISTRYTPAVGFIQNTASAGKGNYE